MLYLLIRSLRKTPSTTDSLLLGIAISAALLTKTTAIILVPVVVAAFFLGSNIGTLRNVMLKHIAIVLITVLVLSGWWFVRNAALYGELLPLHAFRQSFGGTAQAADVVNGSLIPGVSGWDGYAILVSKWCFQSFWAVYGTPASARIGFPLFLPSSIYLLLLGISIAAIAGITKLHFKRKAEFVKPEQFGIYIELLTLCLVTAAYVLFISTYFQTQGRYLYPAMSPICLFLAMGWLELFPVRYKRQAAAGLLTLLCLISVAFLIQTSNRIAPPAQAQISAQTSSLNPSTHISKKDTT